MVTVQQIVWTNTAIFIGALLLLMHFMTRGFLFTFLEAKVSRGKKKLIKIYTVVDVYFKTCRIKNGQLTYKNRAKEKKTLNITEDQAWDFLGVKCFETSEEKDCVINKKFDNVQAYDATIQDMLVEKALTKPGLTQDDKVLKMVKFALFGVVIAILISIMLIYHVFTLKDIVIGMAGGKGII